VRSVQLVFVLCALLTSTACESISAMEIMVYEDIAPDDGLIYHKQVWGHLDATPMTYTPVANACVAVWDEAPGDEEPASDCTSASSDAGHGPGRDWPVVLRSDSAGFAKYSELRLHVIPFVGVGSVRRHIVVTAPGYEPRGIDVEIGSRSPTLVVPLRRAD
jgi:hypothetical protein